MKSELDKQLEVNLALEKIKKSAEKLFKDPRYIKILTEAMTESMLTGRQNNEKYYEKIKTLVKEINNEK